MVKIVVGESVPFFLALAVEAFVVSLKVWLVAVSGVLRDCSEGAFLTKCVFFL